jgi:hypothetical protein
VRDNRLSYRGYWSFESCSAVVTHILRNNILTNLHLFIQKYVLYIKKSDAKFLLLISFIHITRSTSPASGFIFSHLMTDYAEF